MTPCCSSNGGLVEQSQRSLVTFVADFDFGALDSAGPSTLCPDDGMLVFFLSCCNLMFFLLFRRQCFRWISARACGGCTVMSGDRFSIANRWKTIVGLDLVLRFNPLRWRQLPLDLLLLRRQRSHLRIFVPSLILSSNIGLHWTKPFYI